MHESAVYASFLPGFRRLVSMFEAVSQIICGTRLSPNHQKTVMIWRTGLSPHHQRSVISTDPERSEWGSGETPAFCSFSPASFRLPCLAFPLSSFAARGGSAFALLALALAIPTQSHAQWEIEESHTTASLRGIHNAGGGVAWASGTNGTVLRTEDGGYLWQTCAIPPGAEKLDFRGIQAFDENIAIVMSSGPGDQSRLYKTTDGCQTWKLLFTNPEKDGFWDAVTAHRAGPLDGPSCPSPGHAIAGSIFGDPSVHKSNQFDTTTHPSFYLAKFTINASCSDDVLNPSASSIFSGPDEAAFAASNSVLYQPGPSVFWLATAREIVQYEKSTSLPSHYETVSVCGIDVPFRRATSAQGVFSFAVRPDSIEKPEARKISAGPRCLKADVVAVGGDYEAPDDQNTTAAFTAGGNKFRLAKTMPHGYRSAVAYDAPTKLWITVGPNGTDISTDDGRNWRPLTPTSQDDKDADKNWNALSLPFVVGPHGRIGKLRANALPSVPAKAK